MIISKKYSYHKTERKDRRKEGRLEGVMEGDKGVRKL